MRVLIIGFGNPLRSDDGLGWHVAEQLSRQLSQNDVQVIAVHQLTPEMAELASHVERMLFIDASRMGEPGTLQCETVVPAVASSRYSHDLSPAALLGLAQELYGRCPEAYLLSIAGECFETGDTMSATVEKAIPSLLAEVDRLLDSAG
jgi:hydrogenase maturation protease